jgi:hypothetical protein
MPRILVVLPWVLGACILAAQDPANTPPLSDSDKIPVHNLPIDPAQLANAVRDSYYHPDGLSGLECNVSLDWSGIMHALKVDDPSPEQLKIVEGLKISTRSTRNKATEVTFNWSGGEPPEGKETIEGGIRQMASGFYQMYWPMIASSSVPPGTAFEKIEPLDDGRIRARISQAAGHTEITIDKDHIPTHYSVENPAMKATIEAHYTASPKPVPGDLRRVTELDVSNHMGTSTMNVEVILDYQAVDEFYVPQHVTFNVVGAFSIGMDFSACSASKGAAGADVKN